MRRSSRFAVVSSACLLGACLFPNLSGLSGDNGLSGEGGNDSSQDTATTEGSSDSATADESDAPHDAPVWQTNPGDIHVYYASVTGAVSARAWSHTSSKWAAASPVATFSGEIVPWVQPASNGSAEVVSLSSWSGSVSSNASLHLLAQPNLAEVVSGKQIPGNAAAHRAFDVTSETVSGGRLAVFSDGSSNPQFAETNSGTWSPPAPIFPTAPSSSGVDWMQLVTSPTSDEITLVYSDAAHSLFAITWNGSAWMANSPTKLDSNGLNVADFPSFVGAYGTQSGDLLVTWAHPSTCSGAADPLHYSTKVHGTNTFSAPATTAATIAAPGPIVAASDPASNHIALAMLEWCSDAGIRSAGEGDFSAAMWDGTAFVAVNDVDGTPGVDYSAHVGSTPVGVGWVGAYAVAVYAAADSRYAAWSGTGDWVQNPLALSAPLPSILSVQALTTAGGLVLLIEDPSQSLWATSINGTIITDLNGGKPIADALYAGGGRPFGGLVVP